MEHDPQPIGKILETGISTIKQATSAALSRLDPIYLCEKCHRREKQWDGRGASRVERKWCSVCIDGYTRKAGSDRLSCLIPRRYEGASIQDLPESLQTAFADLPDEMGLFLWGATGTGKSHAMCAFFRELWVTGWDVIRISYDMLMLEIRDSYKPGSKDTEMDIILPYMDTGKLIIEDVGTTVSAGAQETDFSLRTFLVLLDQRLEACKATFVTSNKSIEEIRNSFDARIASRLIQACKVIQLKGRDKRMGCGSNP